MKRINGRTKIGAKNHCAHGDNELTGETILDWQPFDYYTVESIPDLSKPTPFDALVTYEFLPIDEGTKTQLDVHFKLLNKLDKEILEPNFQGFAKNLKMFHETMNTMIIAEKKMK